MARVDHLTAQHQEHTMTEAASSYTPPPAPDGFVNVEFNGAYGVVPARSVKRWEARGYKVVDSPEEVERQQEQGAVYDPSEHTAKQVHDHLVSLDRESPEGSAEYDRIVLAEQDGQNRVSAFPSA